MKYATYSEYKASGSNWLGIVPSHWNTLPLKYAADIKTGYAFSSDDFTDEGIPILRISDITKEGKVDLSNAKFLLPKDMSAFKAVTINNSAIVMAMTGATIGKVGCYEFGTPCLLNQRVCSFQTNKNNDQKFLWYLLNADFYIKHIALTAFGGAQPNISDTQLLACDVPLPPLAEQQTIARFLDAKTAQIDALVAQKRQLIDKLKEKRQALIARTVTRGLPPEAAKAAGLKPNPKMKDSGVDWLGAVPAHWGEDKVARLFRAMKGRNAAQLTKEYCATIEGEFPVYSGQTENDGVMSSIDEFEFDAGEDGYLFSTTVGAKAMSLMHLKGEFSLSQNCMVIAPMSDKVQVRFYYYHLQPLFQFERGLIPEHMQASFRMEDLYQYRVAIPPKAEQRAIADYLDKMCATADDLLAATESAIVKLNEYRQALITSAVTGKIDVRNWQSGLEAA